MQRVNQETLTSLEFEVTKTKNLFFQRKTVSSSQNNAEQRLQKLGSQFDKIQGIVESLTTFRDFEGSKEKDKKVVSFKRDDIN